MSTITSTTQLRLINNLANLGTASATDLFLIQKNLKTFKFQYGDLVSNLPDDTTLEAISNKIQIKDGGITTSKILAGNVTKDKIEDIGNMTVLGNTSGSDDTPSEVDILDDSSMITASATTLATSGSIKDYVDSQRPEFVNFTGGTIALTQTSNGTYIYNIVDFTGTGLDNSKIISIHLSIDINSIYGQENVYAKFPDGTEYVICSISSNDNNRPLSHNSVPVIPINSSQTTFEIRMVKGTGGSRSVKLIGATQIP